MDRQEIKGFSRSKTHERNRTEWPQVHVIARIDACAVWRVRRSTDKQTVNRLFYGDNLDVLRRHVPDDRVDLIYLDPPFKSEQNYNVLFAERDGTLSASQLHAFE